MVTDRNDIEIKLNQFIKLRLAQKTKNFLSYGGDENLPGSLLSQDGRTGEVTGLAHHSNQARVRFPGDIAGWIDGMDLEVS